jgi:predicted ATP-grasp superfamily ATP-dependent carboligase
MLTADRAPAYRCLPTRKFMLISVRALDAAGTAVLITDGEERSALAVVRSLGRAGYRVHVSAKRGRSLAATSRWAIGSLVTPDPLRASDQYVASISAYAASHDIEFVIPVTDASMVALLPARHRLGGARIPCGSLDSYRALSDKSALVDSASALGISVPPEVRLAWESRDEPLLDGVPLPAVVKPARSVAGEVGGRKKFVVHHVATVRELHETVRALPRAAFPLLIQQRIVGPGVGVFLLHWEGRLIAYFAHCRLREKPPSGGVSVYAESIVVSDDLLERSRALLNASGWSGVAMVEYKLEQTSSTPYLMEVNGRFWGSLQLAIDAGVDFPRLLMDCALGRPSANLPPYRVGTRARWWWGDVDHLLARLRHRNHALSLPPGAPSRAAAGRAFFNACLRRDADMIWRRDDPRPFLAETASWLDRR